jgi:hypothetical protein
MDMDAMARWGAADVVRYHIVGVYQGTSYVASDGSGWTWTLTPSLTR